MRLPLSGAPWLSSLPPSWQVKPIAALFTERNQRNDGIGQKQLLSLSYGRVVRKDIDANDGLRPESYDTYQQLEPDNIVLRLIDLQNDKRSIRVGLATEKGIITSAYVALDTDAWACPRYAFYLLLVLDQLKVFYGLGSGMRQSITFSDLGRVPVGMPSEQEQYAIAYYLDAETERIDGLIEGKHTLKDLLTELRSATISDAVLGRIDMSTGRRRNHGDGEARHKDAEGSFGKNESTPRPWLSAIPDSWSVQRIKHVVHFAGGGTPSKAVDDYWGGDIPWISPKDMKSFRINESQDKITEAALASSACSLIPVGATLMVVRSGILQHTIPVAVNDVPVCLNQDMKALIPEEGIVSEYLAYLIQGLNDRLLDDWVKQGATVESIDHESMANTPIPVPPFDQQIAIASYLDAETARIDELIAHVNREIALLEELRSATIIDAVLGRIDIREHMKH